MDQFGKLLRMAQYLLVYCVKEPFGQFRTKFKTRRAANRKAGQMLRLGSNLFQMRTVRDDDILISRLKLLIIMAKAYLQDVSLGNCSLRSIIRNSGHVSDFLCEWNAHLNHMECGRNIQINFGTDHIFYQRIKLLSIMLKSIAQGNPLGIHRKTALKSNVDYIADKLPQLQPVHRPALSVVK